MKPARKLLLIVAALVGLLLLVILLAFMAPVQTWAARRMLASQPAWDASVGRVSVGFHQVRIDECRLNYAGAVLTLPSLVADVGIREAALHDRVGISKLVARGWILDLTNYAGMDKLALSVPSAAPASFSLISTAHAAEPPPAVQTVFQGVFHQLHLPVDLALDGVSLEGTVILPETATKPAVRIQAELVGGGLAAGKEALFNLSARFDVHGNGAVVTAMDVRGVVNAVMDTPRTFTKFTADLDSQASGPAFPQGVQLTADLSAARVPGGESYAATVQSVGKRLLDIQANYPANSSRLGGVWRLDMRDTDVAPFTLGRSLPTFEAVGAGMFEADTGFAEIHTAGRIKSSASQLEILYPELVDVGALTVFGEFDLTQTDQSTRLDRLTLTVNGQDPILSVNSLQSFEFSPRTGELKVADPKEDLLAIELQGVPTVWSRPFLQNLELRGGKIAGRLTASARDGGLLLRSVKPLAVDRIGLAHAGQLLTKPLAAALSFTADYTPMGWQADIPQFRLSHEGRTMLTLALKAGQLTGADQPLKTTGHLTLALTELLQQPLAQGWAETAGGTMELDFSSTVGAHQELQAKARLSGVSRSDGEAMPEIACDARATIDSSGAIKFNLPLIFRNAGKQRSSDLVIGGALKPMGEGYHIEGRLGGNKVFIEDLQLLAGVVSARSSGSIPEVAVSGQESMRDALPFWHGFDGSIEVALKQLHYADQFEIKDVAGTIGIAAGTLKLDGVRAGVGEAGSVKADAGVKFNKTAPQPYTMEADVAVADFDPGPLFKAIDPARPPEVEGLFDLETKVASQGINAGDLLFRAKGDLQLTSKGGVFRLLSTDVSSKVETAGKVASIGAFIGNVASALRPGKDASDFANNAQAVAELSRMLSEIHYDQLNVVMARDETLNTALQNFTLIAPEIRLEGKGQLTDVPGMELMEQPLSMKFEMKARGHMGDVLRYLRVMEEQQDELGYATCTLPLNVSGTLAAPDTSEIRTALTKLAIERSGAGDLFNRLLGK